MNTWEKIRLIYEADQGVVVTKKTNYPKSFTLTHDEFKKYLDVTSKGGDVTMNVVSAKDAKPIAQLDAGDLQTSLLKMKPSLQLVNGEDGEKGEYFVCQIPKQSFAKVKNIVGRTMPNESSFGGGSSPGDGWTGEEEIQEAGGGRCNCENRACEELKDHKAGDCKRPAGEIKALYLGSLCDICGERMPKEYLFSPHGSARK